MGPLKALIGLAGTNGEATTPGAGLASSSGTTTGAGMSVSTLGTGGSTNSGTTGAGLCGSAKTKGNRFIASNSASQVPDRLEKSPHTSQSEDGINYLSNRRS